MTISSTLRKAGPFAGNGVATTFPFAFAIFDKTDVKVVLVDELGVSSTLTLDSNYSVVVNANQSANPGGSITYPISGLPLAVGYQLVLLGNLANDQPTDITNSGGFYPTVIEDMSDRSTIQIQQLAENVSRAIVLNESESGSPVLPNPAGRANSLLGFDALGNLEMMPLTASVGAGDLRTDIFISDTLPNPHGWPTFTAGVSTSLTLSRAPGSLSNVEVHFDAGYQGPDQLSGLNGQILALASAIPVGTSQVFVETGTTLSTFLPPDSSVTSSKIAPGAVTADKIQQVASGQFFSGNGAQVNRFNDRMLVGDATVGDAAFPNVNKDWLAAYQTYFGGSGPSVTTMAIFLAQGEPFLAGARTAGNPSVGANAIGVQGYALANNPAKGGDFAWAFYGEGHRVSASASNCYGAEICVVNRGDTKVLTPYSSLPGTTIGIQIDSGCGFNHAAMPDVVSASAAMVIVDNTGGSAPFLAGFVFPVGSVQDSFGNHDAIVLPQNYGMRWWTPANLPSSFIKGGVGTAANATGLAFADAGLEVQNASNQVLALFPPIANATNYPQISAAASGGAVLVKASGTDTNINLALFPQGAGTLQLGVPWTAGSGFTINGHMDFIDSGGTARRVATI